MSDKKKKKKCRVIVKQKIDQKEKKEDVINVDVIPLIEDLRKKVIILDRNFDRMIEHVNKKEEPEEPPPYPS